MTKIAPGAASQVETMEGFEGRYEDLGGYTVGFERYSADGDPSPLFAGLPDDACQCPHWGVVLEGELVYRYTDGNDEAIGAGEAYCAALAVRWFAPGEATTVHDHGSWGAAVVLEGALRYERFETVGNTVVAGSTFWIENDDIVWWDGPPSDVHRQTSGDLGALELIAVGAAPTGSTVQVTDHLGDARPLIDAVRDCYLTRDASLLSNWYADDVVADVCVPAWRFQLREREQVLELLTAEELGQPNQRLTSFRAWPMPEGAIIEVAVRFADGGGTKAWRDLRVLRSCAGRIVEQVTYCTGHWDAAAIAAQEATAPMVRP